MSEKLEALVEQLDGLTLLEASELSKMLQEKWGVSAAAPVAVAAGAPGAAPAAAEAAEEQSEFDVILQDVGAKKIQVIKAVRGLTNLGLKEAKDLVESAPAPVLQAVDKGQAQQAREALESEGASVEIK